MASIPNSPAHTCPACQGYGALPCGACDGVGQIVAAAPTTGAQLPAPPISEKCRDCHGKGAISCQVCHGKGTRGPAPASTFASTRYV